MPFSTEYANRILNCAFGKTDMNAPSQVYIGLSTNNPVADGGAFAELNVDGYERIMIYSEQAGAEIKVGSAENRLIQNTKQINWTKAVVTWPRVNGFGLFTSATGGNPYFYGKLRLTEEEEAAGGMLCSAGSVALLSPGDLKVGISSVDEEIA